MLRHEVSREATHQEAPGATIVLRDDLTYARQHAGFSRRARAAQISATRTEQLPTMWTGTPSTRKRLLPRPDRASAPSTMWTAACAILQRPNVGEIPSRANHGGVS